MFRDELIDVFKEVLKIESHKSTGHPLYNDGGRTYMANCLVDSMQKLITGENKCLKNST